MIHLKIQNQLLDFDAEYLQSTVIDNVMELEDIHCETVNTLEIDIPPGIIINQPILNFLCDLANVCSSSGYTKSRDYFAIPHEVSTFLDDINDINDIETPMLDINNMIKLTDYLDMKILLRVLLIFFKVIK